MPYDPHRHHRRSIRLKGYDYTQLGYYFVTICTHAREPIFDDPVLHRVAEEQWQALDHAGQRGVHHDQVSIDTWIVMHDHVHGIIVIGDGGAVGAQQPGGAPTTYISAAAAPQRHWTDKIDDREPQINVIPGSLGAIVRSYKAAVTRRINQRRRLRGVSIWQRGYYERIIRNERELANVRRYIVDNPSRHALRLDALLARMQHRENQ